MGVFSASEYGSHMLGYGRRGHIAHTMATRKRVPVRGTELLALYVARVPFLVRVLHMGKRFKTSTAADTKSELY